MSTVLIVLKHELPGGRLVRFVPTLRGRQTLGRPLSVETGVHDWIRTDTEPLLRPAKAAINAHLSRYARGQLINDCEFMKRVEDRRVPSNQFGHGIWSISPRFNPQYRFFGSFVIKDWFVILNKQSRDYLDDIDSRWHAEIDNSLALWGTLFPGRAPWIRDSLNEYVSSNVEKCDDRW
jgi:hypothetical protein